jgi:hypothetical protein
VDTDEKIETLRIALRALYQLVAALEQGNGQRSRSSKRSSHVGRAPTTQQVRVIREGIK